MLGGCQLALMDERLTSAGARLHHQVKGKLQVSSCLSIRKPAGYGSERRLVSDVGHFESIAKSGEVHS
jgi:hypothetical protein